MKQLEKKLSHNIAEFLTKQYPKVIFRFDVGADIKLTIGQASIVKNKLLHEKGYPDLFIPEPSHGYHGLYVELKKDHEAVYKKDGSYKKNDHLETQIAMHKRLRDKVYKVVFGCGFEDTISKIRYYMSSEVKEDSRQGKLC